MKILVIPLIALAVIIGLGVFENIYLNQKFSAFEDKLEELYINTEDETSTYNDVILLEDWWSAEKAKFHIFIPHTIIKEIDFYMSEAKGLIKTERFDVALGKIEVLKTLAKAIPDSFTVNFGNIF